MFNRSVMVLVCCSILLSTSCRSDNNAQENVATMAGIMVPVVVITKAEEESIFRCGCHPLVGEYDEQEFREEIEGVYSDVKTAIEERGWRCWSPGVLQGGLMDENDEVVNTCSDSDFFMSMEFDSARCIGVEVTNEKMLTMDLLETVYRVVSQCERDYCVVVLSGGFALRTANGDIWPSFDIYVEKERILVCTESDRLLRQLGVNR